MKTVQFILLITFMLVSFWSCSTQARQKEAVTSPDKNITLKFQLNKGVPTYYVIYKNDTIIKPSCLGFEFKNQTSMKDQFVVMNSEITSVDYCWEQHWGQNKKVKDQYSELKIQLQEENNHARLLTLYFRVYDDGVAFRYEFPDQVNLKDFVIMNELTEFNISGNPDTWWIPADYNSYEKLYQKTILQKAIWVATPVTLKTDNNTYLSVHEAALTNYAGMTLKQNKEGTYQSELVPWANGDKVRTSAPMKTPWRTIQISPSAKNLLASNMILNLNEPSKIKDVSWIKPMKYIGIWWGMHLGTETWYAGPRHGAKTQNAIDHIDFAADNNIQGVVVEGWNAGWENWGAKNAFDNITPASDYDLKKVAQYARKKGVMLIGHHETGGDVPTYEKYVEKGFQQCRELGIHAVKTGYAGGIYPRGEYHHGQYMVNHYRKIVELAAKYHIMLDVHEPIKPTGIRRTWPNMMTREGVRGMEWNAWSSGNPPSHTVIIPFTRGLGGPIDYNPGTFDLLFKNASNRVKWNTDDIEQTRTHSTLAKQLANFVILYSPIQMASDLMKNYRNHPAFQFIRDFNANIDETEILNGEIGEFVTIARRSGNNWYLGSATNENARTLSVNLSFLNKKNSYVAHIYMDAKESDYKSNPYAYEMENRVVDANTTIEINLAPGGGQAIFFEMIN